MTVTLKFRLKIFLILGFLTLLNILNFTGRLLPTSLGKQIEDALQFGHGSLGLLSGYYFVLTYTFSSLAFGFLADRFRRSRIVFFGVVLWGSMTALSGLAQSFGFLITARMIFGVGQAALTPAALSIISELFPLPRRAMATGIYYSGLPLGGGLSLMVSAWLAPAMGWRACFITVGVLTIVLAIPALFLNSNETFLSSQATRKRSGGKPPHLPPELIFTLLGSICVVFMSAAGNLRMVWLQNERGFDVSIGKIAGLMYMFGGIAGTLIGGALGDAWERRRPGGRLLFAAWAQLILTPIVILSYLLSPASPLFYITWFGAMLGTTLYYGPIYSAIQDVVPIERRATAVGILIFSVNLLGVGPGPWFAGLLGDAYSLTLGLSVASAISFLAFPFFLLSYRFMRLNRQ